MKKLIIISILFSVVSCASWVGEEREKSGKAAAASSRINASDENSKDVFKEVDE